MRRLGLLVLIISIVAWAARRPMVGTHALAPEVNIDGGATWTTVYWVTAKGDYCAHMVKREPDVGFMGWIIYDDRRHKQVDKLAGKWDHKDNLYHYWTEDQARAYVETRMCLP